LRDFYIKSLQARQIIVKISWFLRQKTVPNPIKGVIFASMISFQKNVRPFWIAVCCLLALQAFWLCHSYQLTRKEFLTDIDRAFDEACQKEQTYRMPVNNIIHSSDLTIQSCGNEEIKIIRKCPSPDTIVYDNVSGQSLETVINRALYQLRETIIPLNIYCLADLFAGALYDRDISLAFTIDRFNIMTGDILETTVPAGEKRPETVSTHVEVINISATEGLRANLRFSFPAVFSRMASVLLLSAGLLLAVLICLGMSMRFLRRAEQPLENTPPSTASTPHDTVFTIGNYVFDAEKNTLQGVGKTVQLNKKENAILQALCVERGNVVERAAMLEQHWGNTGVVYTRSLDTYIAKLRRYLKEDPTVQIITIKSLGYKLMVQDA